MNLAVAVLLTLMTLLQAQLEPGRGSGRQPAPAQATPAEATPPEVDPPEVEPMVRGVPACQLPAVLTRAGNVCGLLLERPGGSVATYLGIPFGEDTGGERRWQPPATKAPWQGVLRATAPGNICPQPDNPLRAQGLPEAAPQDEDCLYLNVWAPAGASSAPVLVYIHGGGFTNGSSTDNVVPGSDWHLQDGSFLAAAEDVVVVSMNYRLGALGFMAGILGLEGNYGLLDQRLALQWVRENIADFGGNPGHVTLVGESAGAMSVGLHLLSAPESSHLFHAAIMESNPLGLPYPDMASANLVAETFMLRAGCLFRFDQLGCLRALPVENLLAVQQGWELNLGVLERGLAGVLPWLPVIDGTVLERQPLEAAQLHGIEKPMIIGYTSDEGLLFVAYALEQPLSTLLYSGAIDVLYGQSRAPAIRAQYPAETGVDERETLARVVNDSLFVCPALALAALSRTQSYVYEFTHAPSFDIDDTISMCSGRACHATELSFVFGTGGFEDGFDEDEAELSRQIMAYWASFGPVPASPEGLPQWPAYDSGAPQVLEFGIPLRSSQPKQDECGIWWPAPPANNLEGR